MFENAVMIDLETMGNGPLAAILSIGAVRFTMEGCIDQFEAHVDLDSCLAMGMQIDGDTILWWLKQPDGARGALARPRRTLIRVLEHFTFWIGKPTSVWGNGIDFDNAILASAYRQCGLRQPWRYSVNLCYRTVKSLYPQVEFQRSGTHHNAVDDARSQALHLLQCLKIAAKLGS